MKAQSRARPLDYYQNNTATSHNLIQVCIDQGVEHFVFSSTAAVYGTTDLVPVTETAPANPLNPYGRSKLMVEWMLEDTNRVHDFRYVALRHFNVAGVDAEGCGGQPDRQVPHLMKRAAQVATGLHGHLDIFGSDYPTDDGTAVRDYIHICDLVDAHVLALKHLRAGGASSIYNCCGFQTGNGAAAAEKSDRLETMATHCLEFIRTGCAPKPGVKKCRSVSPLIFLGGLYEEPCFSFRQ